MCTITSTFSLHVASLWSAELHRWGHLPHQLLIRVELIPCGLPCVDWLHWRYFELIGIRSGLVSTRFRRDAVALPR